MDVLTTHNDVKFTQNDTHDEGVIVEPSNGIFVALVLEYENGTVINATVEDLIDASSLSPQALSQARKSWLPSEATQLPTPLSEPPLLKRQKANGEVPLF